MASVKTFGWRTDGRGAFHFRDGKLIERFTFVGTGGALRSDHIYGVFVDAEEVVWFATDKGVCRYDPNAARTEAIGPRRQRQLRTRALAHLERSAGRHKCRIVR